MGALKYYDTGSGTWKFLDQWNNGNSTIVGSEDLTGLTNGTNRIFTTNQNFATIDVYKNGVHMRAGASADYVVTGANQITFNVSTTPTTGSTVNATYTTQNTANVIGSASFITSEVPTGTINGTNKVFTTALAYIGSTLQVYLNGLRQAVTTHYLETNPATKTFTFDEAPSTGDVITVSYQTAVYTAGNSDTVDGFHASSTPAPNSLVSLTSNSRFPGNTMAKMLYEYTATTDLYSATTIPANTWTDVIASNNFTVSSSTSMIIIDVRAQMQLGENNSGNTVSRVLIDIASSPISKKLGGMNVMGVAGAFYANPFAGGGPIILTGLSPGVHTFNVQVFCTVTNKMYLRAGSRQDEFIETQVMEIGG